MSAISWLAYSEAERRSALDVIALFRERDTRDELGLGMIRDAFADLLFPGTSTIQRRARYFLFIAWTYLKLEAKRAPSASVAQRARREEVNLIDELIKAESEEGIIGIQARETLKRLPSSIYCRGLGRLGIRLFPGSQDQYHRSLDRYYRRLEEAGQLRADEEGNPVARIRPNWHAGLPRWPQGFPKAATFALTPTEADYLRERILAAAPSSLLAFLVDRGRPALATAFPWMHPQFGGFPSGIQEALENARCFSEVMHGAALLYNLMLAQKAGSMTKIREYSGALREWRSVIEKRSAALGRWDRSTFWGLVERIAPRLRPRTCRFVDCWVDVVLAARGKGIEADGPARDLILHRERALKGTQARLDNRRALERWGGAAGANQLDYGWGIAQMIVADIQRGLG